MQISHCIPRKMVSIIDNASNVENGQIVNIRGRQVLLFRSKKGRIPDTNATDAQAKDDSIPLQAQKLSVRFDILPEISYLDDSLCCLLIDLFPIMEGFPDSVWISYKTCEEGLDFCQLNFWAFSADPDAIKEFSNWFQGIFRNEEVSGLLERYVRHALEKPNEAEVLLSDWSRVHVTENEVREIVSQELLVRQENHQ